MNLKYFFVFLLVVTMQMGCNSIAEKNSNFLHKRQFDIKTAWVQQGPAKTNLAFRKINRMSPLLYTDKEGINLVISANSIDGIVACKQDSGKIMWRLHVENGVEGSAALINDRLFFGGNDGQFYSIEANTGKIIWTFPTRIENLSEPLLDEGTIYFLTGSNSLYALDAATGKQLWLYTRQDTNPLSVRGGSKPAIRNGILYVGFSDGYLVALTANNGQVKWEKQLNRNKKFKDMDTDPLLDGNFVYALGFDDHLYCLRAATGELVWTSVKGGYGGILILGDRLYYASTTSELLAVDKTTGKIVWSFPMKEGIATTPTLYRGLVTFGESQGDIIFLDSGTGKLIGSFTPGNGILSPPTVDEKYNRIYFISGEANIYALDIGFKYPEPIPYLK